MRYAARDLVERMDGKLSFSVDELYLQNSSNAAFYNSFDHLLREEMTRQGYLLTHSDTEDSVRIDFVGQKNQHLVMLMYRIARISAYNLALVIDAVDGIPSDLVGGFYEVPTYGYVNKGNIKLEVPVILRIRYR